MTVILVILYAFYFILIGANGNASEFLTMVSQEKQFLYWAIVLLVLAALWDTGTAAPLAKAFVLLVVIGFLLSHNNGLTIINNARAILPGLGSSGATGGGTG